MFRDGDEVVLGSRNERPLTRYFPELLDPLRASLPDRCVVDGEVVLARDGALDFDALQQRIHPADSRVQMLAADDPGVASSGSTSSPSATATSWRSRSRRDASLLEEALAGAEAPDPPHAGDDRPATSPRTGSSASRAPVSTACWPSPPTGTYQPDKRVQLKVKHQRTADCVVAGFREHKNGDGPGSLLLGLYDDEGRLHNLGVASSFSVARRRPSCATRWRPTSSTTSATIHGVSGRRPRRTALGEHGRLPGGPSRWNAKKDLSWTPLRPDLVCEVAYERVDNGRFRHSTRLLRWRPDRTPESCTFEQLEVVPPDRAHPGLRTRAERPP